MSGPDGSNKTTEFLDQITSLWKRNHSFLLGIFYCNDVIYTVRLKNTGNHWEVSDHLMIPFSPEPDEKAYCMEMIAEKTAATLQVMGWPPAPAALCLSEQDIFHEMIRLPDMPADEMAEAVRWELDGRRDFAEAEFLSVFLSSPASDGQWAAAVPKSLADSLTGAWKEAGLELASLTAMPAFLRDSCHISDTDLEIGNHNITPPRDLYDAFYENGGWKALYAAETLCFPDLRRLNFLTSGQAPKSDWNWKALSLTVITAAFIGLFGCFLIDQVQLHIAQEALSEQKAQLNLLASVQKEKSELEASVSDIKRKNEQLVRLSGESIPWRSIFVHLGTMTVDGVWLSDISMPKPNTLEIHGKAIHYDALAEFLQKFETDRDFFPTCPVLKSSDLENSGSHPSTVSFQLELELIPGDDRHAKIG